MAPRRTNRRTYRRRRRRVRSRRIKASNIVTKRYLARTRPDAGVFITTYSDNSWQPADLKYHHVGLNIAKGDQMGDRDGDQIYLKGVEMQMTMFNWDTQFRYYIRVVLLKSARPYSDVYADFFVTEATVNAPVDLVGDGDSENLIKKINPAKYRVLADKKFTVGPHGGDRHHLLAKRFYMPINHKMTYTADTPSITDPGYYLVWWIMRGDNAALYGDGQQIMKCRVREYFNK